MTLKMPLLLSHNVGFLGASQFHLAAQAPDVGEVITPIISSPAAEADDDTGDLEEDRAAGEEALAEDDVELGFDVEPPYPGVDFLGLGYNLAYGNPSGDPLTQIDPGFSAPVAVLKWHPDSKTRDARQIVPVGGYAYPEKSCYRAQTAVTMTSMSDYSQALSTDCSVSGGGGYEGFGVSAEVSFSYSESSQGINREECS
jgi:hypothetical protein